MIETISVSHNFLRSGKTGSQLCNTLLDDIDSIEVVDNQDSSMVFDWAYFNTKVDYLVRTRLNYKFLETICMM